MKPTTKRALRDALERYAYACLALSVYGPRMWAGVALALSVSALALNESTPRG
jgi:hypothetical protein